LHVFGEESRDSGSPGGLHQPEETEMQSGNFGDSEPVAEGDIELRVYVGAGYLVYCGRYGIAVVLLLCGGDLSSQASDIKRAKALRSEWKKRQT
jgi:putative addiction module killer protein